MQENENINDIIKEVSAIQSKLVIERMIKKMGNGIGTEAHTHSGKLMFKKTNGVLYVFAVLNMGEGKTRSLNITTIDVKGPLNELSNEMLMKYANNDFVNYIRIGILVHDLAISFGNNKEEDIATTLKVTNHL